jgi:DNA adenine methylase
MSKYCCEKCGKDFKQKSHYTTHINKKKPCVVDVSSKQVIDNAVKEKLGLVEIQIDCDTVGKISITKPLLKWVGGKTQILEKLLGEFPVEMNNYREIFLGGGSVLLAILSYVKSGKIKIYGNIYAYDLNEPLIWVYKNIQTRPDDVFAEIQKIISE